MKLKEGGKVGCKLSILIARLIGKSCYYNTINRLSQPLIFC